MFVKLAMEVLVLLVLQVRRLPQELFQEVVAKAYQECQLGELLYQRMLHKGYHRDSKLQDMGIAVQMDYRPGVVNDDGQDVGGDSFCVQVNCEASRQLDAC